MSGKGRSREGLGTNIEQAHRTSAPQKHAKATELLKRLTPAQRAPASSTRTARAEGGDGKARRNHRAAEATGGRVWCALRRRLTAGGTEAARSYMPRGGSRRRPPRTSVLEGRPHQARICAGTGSYFACQSWQRLGVPVGGGLLAEAGTIVSLGAVCMSSALSRVRAGPRADAVRRVL